MRAGGGLEVGAITAFSLVSLACESSGSGASGDATRGGAGTPSGAATPAGVDVSDPRMGPEYRGPGGIESPGSDVLHVYWYARAHGLLTATD